MDFEPPPSSLPGSPDKDPLGPDFVLEGTEPAWERKEELGLPQAYLETVKQVLLAPNDTFERLFIGGGFVNPLIFMVITSVIVAVFSMLFNVVFGGMMDALTASMASAGGSSASTLPIQTLMRGGGGIAGIFLIPIFSAIGAFISAGIYHLVLMMFGGANNTYEATFRVVAYSIGATMLLQVVPGCGGIAYSIWFCVAAIIGLSRVHQVETWKGAVAVLLPSVICCVLLVGGFAILFGGIAAAAAASSGTTYTP